MPSEVAGQGIEPVTRRATALRRDVGRAYERNIRGRPVEASTLATIAYFITLVLTRWFVTATQGETQDYVLVAGVHIHHLVLGVVAVLIAGLLALDDVFRLTRALVFGIGAALVLDEFALLVFLKDVYWLPQGILSEVALVIGLLALAINAWRGRAFVNEATGILRRHR